MSVYRFINNLRLKMNQTHISKSTIFGITIIVIVYMSPNIGGWSCQNPCSSSPRQLPLSSATLSYDQSHHLGALVACGSLYASSPCTTCACCNWQGPQMNHLVISIRSILNKMCMPLICFRDLRCHGPQPMFPLPMTNSPIRSFGTLCDWYLISDVKSTFTNQ